MCFLLDHTIVRCVDSFWRTPKKDGGAANGRLAVTCEPKKGRGRTDVGTINVLGKTHCRSEDDKEHLVMKLSLSLRAIDFRDSSGEVVGCCVRVHALKPVSKPSAKRALVEASLSGEVSRRGVVSLNKRWESDEGLSGEG